jgi:RHS repeat-associated protein
MGGLLERVIKGGVDDWRHYIKVGGQTVAIVSRKSSGSNLVRYAISDHLGSFSGMLSSAGTLEVNESFTAFGQRRSGTTWRLPTNAAEETALINEEATIAGISRWGYTEHTHLGLTGLTHMNGRVHDSMTGRFLSSDPLAPSSGITQSWNLYSYVHNRPLDFVDPTGFEAEEICQSFTVEPNTTPSNPTARRITGNVWEICEVIVRGP